jgi:ferredoxin
LHLPLILLAGLGELSRIGEACARYRIMNPAGSACGRCMKVCPFNHRWLAQDRRALWLAIHVPAARKPLIWLDSLLERGKRYPVWKWWFDLEVRDGKLGRPVKTNQRDLRPGRQAPPKQLIPVFPSDSVPAPNVPGAQPIDSRNRRTRVSEAQKRR